MNKFLKITMLAAIPLWGLTSCLDDNKYAYFHPNESWGTIVGTPENFKIETDNGNTLRVTENLDPSFPVEDSLRVVATFTPLEQTGENSFDIRVNAMKKLLTKMPVYLSELTPDEIDSLGTDPIDIENAWFGAGEYLNIEFIIFVNDPQKAHFLNLVVDEEKSTPEEVFVTLRHNAFKDETLGTRQLRHRRARSGRQGPDQSHPAMDRIQRSSGQRVGYFQTPGAKLVVLRNAPGRKQRCPYQIRNHPIVRTTDLLPISSDHCFK
jgi:hypothetical protein